MRRRAKPHKPKTVAAKPLQLLAVDTVERIRHGMRPHITTFIDPMSYVASAWAASTKHACASRRALELALAVWPAPPKTPLSDNLCTDI